MRNYNVVTKNQDVILRGTAQQQTTKAARSMLYEGPGGTEATPQTGLEIKDWALQNRTGGAIAVGVGFRYANHYWWAADWDDNSASPTITRVAGYQSRTATELFATITTPANEDGLLIVCKKPFNWVSVNVTTASVDATNPAADFDYWDGDSWVTASAGQAIVDSLTVSGSELTQAEHILAWYPPHDWHPVVDSPADILNNPTGGNRVPAGWYALLWRWGTIADTTQPQFTGIEIGSMQFSGEELADNGIWKPEQTDPYQELIGDGVVAMFETAAAGNMVKVGAIARG